MERLLEAGKVQPPFPQKHNTLKPFQAAQDKNQAVKAQIMLQQKLEVSSILPHAPSALFTKEKTKAVMSNAARALLTPQQVRDGPHISSVSKHLAAKMVRV